jgi:hypothetical protein
VDAAFADGPAVSRASPLRRRESGQQKLPCGDRLRALPVDALWQVGAAA